MVSPAGTSQSIKSVWRPLEVMSSVHVTGKNGLGVEITTPHTAQASKGSVDFYRRAKLESVSGVLH